MGVLDWLHRRHRRRDPDADGACPERLIDEAEKRQREAYERWAVVNAVTAKVDEQGRRNHFGETLDSIYRRAT